MLTAKRLTKRYGRTVALDGVDFVARGGEIQALIGENGAGKSTLINILAGRTRADAGRVELDGAALSHRGTARTLQYGIAAVFQTPMLFERMSWEENLALGGQRRSQFGLDLAAVRVQARVLAGELGFALPPAGAVIADCSIPTRVRIEILRALSINPRVLILDEPTGVLAPAELAAFLATIRSLRGARRAVVLVTHKLREALAVADRVTVLRGGRLAGEFLTAETSEDELARLMIGELPATGPSVSSRRTEGRAAMSLENVAYEADGRRLVDNLSLRIEQGEIVGLAGIEGNGQTELAAILSGAVRPSSGQVRVPAGAALTVIPQDRDRDGLILEMPLWENLLLGNPLRRRFATRAGQVRRRRVMRFCAELIQRFGIRASGPAAPAATLSGGNRQRLVFARALAGAPAAIVAHDPTRGLDLRAVAEVHQRLREFARTGGAVLLISSDLDELFALSDRICVISRGRVTAISPDDYDPARLGLLMSGATA